ncbi:hypothetical protein, partial [Streptomyces griseoluteus]|uniref:hypothetical protein n=1 Tax=Streptomyces griseoluteus TaxID=29306 RepID=UPI0037F38462
MPAIDWSGRRKNPARVWTAGKEKRKRKRRSENLESTEEIGSERSDRVGNTEGKPGGKPERVST